MNIDFVEAKYEANDSICFTPDFAGLWKKGRPKTSHHNRSELEIVLSKSKGESQGEETGGKIVDDLSRSQ